MPRLASNRLVHQLRRETDQMFFGDTAIYYATPSAETGLDSYGQPTQATTGTSIVCSFNDKPNMEKWSEYADIQGIAGEIRLDVLTPNKGGRFEIVGRWDEDDTNSPILEIVGIRQRGVFGYACLLKAVQI